MNTPILFIVFNRPDLTRQAFEAIRNARPQELYVAADGPRSNREGDAALCAETRKIVELVDWDCKVRTLFRDQNLGCRMAVSGAITWFFEHVEQGIIMEDDCVADATFFTFCGEMLERYKHDERVMAISGESYGNSEARDIQDSYSFSGYALFWGWATWRRAWACFDQSLDDLDEKLRQDWFAAYMENKQVVDYWVGNLKLAQSGKLNTWGYRWMMSFWRNHGLCILPRENLVSNIGYDERATHTNYSDPVLSNRGRGKLPHPLVHPQTVRRDYSLDNMLNRERFRISMVTPPKRPTSRELAHDVVSAVRELGVRAVRRSRRVIPVF